MKFLIFIFIFYLSLISVLGYGILFNKVCFGLKKNENQNAIFIGFYGLFFLTLFSMFSSFFFKHNFIHNAPLHIAGIIFFIFLNFSQKRKLLKTIFLISLFTFAALLISKTHDDFSYYHLPFVGYLTENKVIFGMGNIGHGYNLISSLFFLNSIFYLPFIEFYGFHFSLLLYLIFFNFFLLKEIFSDKNHEIIKILYLLAFTFFNLSFNRFAEYGTDKVGQILIVLLVIKLFQFICLEKDKLKINNLLHILPLFGLCISLKTYFLPYVLLGLTIFFINFKFFEIFRKILASRSFLAFITIILIYFLHHFVSTGCLISPISQTCFGNYFDWARDNIQVKNLSLWLEQWAKAGAGPNFRVDDPSDYIKKLNWFSHWVEKYFLGKFIEQFSLLLSTLFLIFLLFKKFKLKKENFFNKKIILFYFVIIIIFLIWFLKHPTLRYGGYSIIFLTLSIPFSYLSYNFESRNNFNKRFKYIVLFVLIVFNIKNINRISNELERNDIYKFDNFPFFAINKKDYLIKKFSAGLTIYETKGHCWNTPTPCTNGMDSTLKVRKNHGYYFIYK